MPPGSRRWEEIDEKLPADHQARMVRQLVDELDPQSLRTIYRRGGQVAYDPIVLLRMVLYMMLQGIGSPAQWFEQAKFNEAVQWLGNGYVPARRTWYDFRDRVGQEIEELNAQLVQMAINQQLVDPSEGVQDGTSIAACASRHRMVNEQTLLTRQELLADLLEGSVVDDATLPKWVPPTDVGRQDLAKRMERAHEILQKRIEENAKRPADKRKDRGKVQVSLSDPDAPLGRDKLKVYRPLYTVQYLIEPKSHLILGYQCDPTVGDTGTLAPMMDRVQKIVGGRLRRVMADAAYCTILDLRDCQERGIDLLAPVQTNSLAKPKMNTNGVGLSNRDQFHWDPELQTFHCPAGHELKYVSKQVKSRQGDRTLTQFRYHCSADHCLSCPLASGCVRDPSKGRTVTRMEGQELLDAQRQKMEQPEVKAHYKLRGQTVELGFADAKGNRRVDRFHGRGVTRGRTETGLLVFAQNLLRLSRLQRNAVTTGENET